MAPWELSVIETVVLLVITAVAGTILVLLAIPSYRHGMWEFAREFAAEFRR